MNEHQDTKHMFTALPPHLSERCRVLTDRPVQPDGEMVLYWMHHVVRGHENPALDVAVSIANRLRLPVLVYQGLGGGATIPSSWRAPATPIASCGSEEFAPHSTWTRNPAALPPPGGSW